MSSPHSSMSSSQTLLGDYLDHLCAPLLGVVPYAQRLRLRGEAEDHLLSIAEDFEAEGFSPEEAVAQALQEYGEPYQIGQAWAESWVSGAERDRGRVRTIDPLTLRAFGWFGVFTVLNLLLLERQTFLARRDDLFPLGQLICAVSPIVAGIATGLNFHPRMALRICHAVLLLAAFSAAVGIQLLPQWDGLSFALIQCVYWVPVGCLFAMMAAHLRRQFRIRRFRSLSC